MQKVPELVFLCRTKLGERLGRSEELAGFHRI